MLTVILITNGLIILANLIYVVPAINISDDSYPDGKQGDILKIKELEELTATGWANGNGLQLASAFTENADYVTFNGQRLKGKQAIADVH